MIPAPVEYDPCLREDAVRAGLHAGVQGIPYARLARIRLDARGRLDRAYSLGPGEERERAFRDAFCLLFDRLGFDRPMAAALRPFPPLTGLQGRLARPARERDGVSVDLWEQRERRGDGIPAFLVAAIPPERFRDPAALESMLLPGMQRAADLMSTQFGFRRETRVLGSRAADPAVRRTYESLWDLSARVRLGADGRMKRPPLEAEAAVLAGTATSPLVADVVRLCGSRVVPTHDDLLGLAGRIVAAGRVDQVAGDRDAAHERTPALGTYRSTYERRCPLCRFPTCEWAGNDSLRRIADIVRSDHATWSLEAGACAHCAERYALLGPTPAVPDGSAVGS